MKTQTYSDTSLSGSTSAAWSTSRGCASRRWRVHHKAGSLVCLRSSWPKPAPRPTSRSSDTYVLLRWPCQHFPHPKPRTSVDSVTAKTSWAEFTVHEPPGRFFSGETDTRRISASKSGEARSGKNKHILLKVFRRHWWVCWATVRASLDRDPHVRPSSPCVGKLLT